MARAEIHLSLAGLLHEQAVEVPGPLEPRCAAPSFGPTTGNAGGGAAAVGLPRTPISPHRVPDDADDRSLQPAAAQGLPRSRCDRRWSTPLRNTGAVGQCAVESGQLLWSTPCRVIRPRNLIEAGGVVRGGAAGPRHRDTDPLGRAGCWQPGQTYCPSRRLRPGKAKLSMTPAISSRSSATTTPVRTVRGVLDEIPGSRRWPPHGGPRGMTRY